MFERHRTTTPWEYREWVALPERAPGAAPEASNPKEAAAVVVQGSTEEQVAARIHSALLQAERQHESKLQAVRERFQQQLQEFIRTTADHQIAYKRQVETEVTRLSLAIAERVLQQELSVQPLALGSLLHGALEQVHAGEQIVLHVPEKDYAAWNEYMRALGTRHSWQITSDPSIQSGEISIHTGQGTANLSISAKLEVLKAALLNSIDQLYASASHNAMDADQVFPSTRSEGASEAAT